MKKMLKYYFEKKILFIAVTTVILLALSFSFIHNKSFVSYSYPAPPYYIDYLKGPASPPIMFITIMACILTIIIPVIEFKFKMKKISIDQMYSLPIKRGKLYLTRFIFGFIEILIPITILFFDCIITILLSEHMFDMKYFFIYYLCLVGMIFILYSTVAFFFSRGNTIIDGIMNIGFITFLFVFAVMAFNSLKPNKNVHVWGSDFFIFSPLINISNYFMDKVCEKSVNNIGAAFNVDVLDETQIFSLVMFIVIGIVSFILFYFINKNDKAEDSMQISNSWFSYKTFIPLYIILLSLYGALSFDDLIFYIIISIMGFVAYVIYRRGLKFKKYDYIILFVIPLLVFIIL